ncbi:hypothetical protein KRE47_08795 [Elizabethkingia meningoseptica]|uniref:hypothetical protein n=1 Tax=Elizabethkingia meningoseptica TaxID=238 RepID=UPI00099A28EC|nr:hypothetical protein [Elizabethkingia meningoseptica]EJK5329776.1 hypothetical protein [Elizabethkingia meningoseptica]MDE5469135.1 hypothetical protein [Elizabethkingia meningoseptica]MDE5475049.1 hypothetical protein [Elizabethkingia meningoseptica]MDE5478482.1 hypothetical protein [Elizabethkingia meningoseptica]MDE5486176.1 hypothetical protein [Elizabethkingia meningoseptica]
MKFNVLIPVVFFTIFSCKAQEITEKGTYYAKVLNKNRYSTTKIDAKAYDVFYNETVAKLNKIIPKKTNFYGKPLSVFLEELKKNNLIPVEGYYKSYEDNELWQPNGLQLHFSDWDIRHVLNELNKSYPSIEITFTDNFKNSNIRSITSSNGTQWNDTLINSYKNLIVKKIRFRNVFGVNTRGGNRSK